MSDRRKVRGFKRNELVLPEAETLPFSEREVTAQDELDDDGARTLDRTTSVPMTSRTTTMRNLHSYARDEWAPKPLRGWLALRESTGWFGLLGRTWVPYWCVFDSRYLLLFPSKPGSNETAQATGYSVTPLDPSAARSTITVAPTGITKTEIPLPSMMIDLGLSTVEARFEDDQLYAFVHRNNFPEYVLCGNHIKYWIHEWQKINTIWTFEDGSMLDVPTDAVDKAGNVMEPRMDSAERFFLRQQGAFLLYMAGPLQFEAWNSRLGGKWFLHYCTFDAYDPSPKLCIFSDGKDPNDATPPKILDLTNATVSEHLDERQRAKMKIELPNKPAIICDGPNIQWWLGALQWATRDKTKGKAMFRELIKHRRFVPVQKSISVLRMQRRATSNSLKRSSGSIIHKDSGINKEKYAADRQRTLDLAQKHKDNSWKHKSGSSALDGSALNGNSSTGTRLSAAEFARQSESTPPRKGGRRSSAPRPTHSALNKDPPPDTENMSSSRAQIPLISLSIPTGEEEALTPNQGDPSPRAAAALNPRRKSKRSKSRSPTPSPRAQSPISASLTVDEEALGEDEPEAALSPTNPLSEITSPNDSPPSNVDSVLLTEDDIAKTPAATPRDPNPLASPEP